MQPRVASNLGSSLSQLPRYWDFSLCHHTQVWYGVSLCPFLVIELKNRQNEPGARFLGTTKHGKKHH